MAEPAPLLAEVAVTQQELACFPSSAHCWSSACRQSATICESSSSRRRVWNPPREVPQWFQEQGATAEHQQMPAPVALAGADHSPEEVAPEVVKLIPAFIELVWAG